MRSPGYTDSDRPPSRQPVSLREDYSAQFARCSGAGSVLLAATCAVLRAGIALLAATRAVLRCRSRPPQRKSHGARNRNRAAQRKSHGAPEHVARCSKQLARCFGAGTDLRSANRTVLRASGAVLGTTCALLRNRSRAAQRKSHGAPEHVVRCSKHLARCFGAGTALPSANRTVLQSTWLGARNTLRGASVQEPLCPAQLALSPEHVAQCSKKVARCSGAGVAPSFLVRILELARDGTDKSICATNPGHVAQTLLSVRRWRSHRSGRPGSGVSSVDAALQKRSDHWTPSCGKLYLARGCALVVSDRHRFSMLHSSA
jgi:hypothetical protein